MARSIWAAGSAMVIPGRPVVVEDCCTKGGISSGSTESAGRSRNGRGRDTPRFDVCVSNVIDDTGMGKTVWVESALEVSSGRSLLSDGTLLLDSSVVKDGTGGSSFMSFGTDLVVECESSVCVEIDFMAGFEYPLGVSGAETESVHLFGSCDLNHSDGGSRTTPAK